MFVDWSCKSLTSFDSDSFNYDNYTYFMHLNILVPFFLRLRFSTRDFISNLVYEVPLYLPCTPCQVQGKMHRGNQRKWDFFLKRKLQSCY